MLKKDIKTARFVLRRISMKTVINVASYYYKCCKCGHEQDEFKSSICEECSEVPLTKEVVCNHTWVTTTLSDLEVSSIIYEIAKKIDRSGEE
jgi:hypothetical protein